MSVVLLAFVLSLFFKTPPLRAKSALQEAADERDEKQAAEDDEKARAADAATKTGSLVLP